MTPVQVFTARVCLDHDQGAGHPEQPARLAAVLQALRARPGAKITEAGPALMDTLLRCHDVRYLERAAAISARGGGELGADTILNGSSWDAAVGASGAALAALDHALSGAGNSFAAIRPPGHHAMRNRAMGFCITNHAALVAAAAHAGGREKVLIVDWDVHHGNGTQALVEDDPRTRFVSMHQWPWYPGTGAAEDRGTDNCFNVPMPPGLRPELYVDALWRGIEAAISNWTPDLIVVSAGYDSMLGDPLGGFTLEAAHYPIWIERLRERCPAAPIVALMEGGYTPALLASGVVATVAALA